MLTHCIEPVKAKLDVEGISGKALTTLNEVEHSRVTTVCQSGVTTAITARNLCAALHDPLAGALDEIQIETALKCIVFRPVEALDDFGQNPFVMTVGKRLTDDVGVDDAGQSRC